MKATGPTSIARVIGYEMLGGRPPFSARRTGEFGLKLLNESPAPLGR